MGIENISNKRITREIFEKAQDIPENDRRELLTIFDSADSIEEDNQLGVLTEEEAIVAFLDMVQQCLSRCFDKVLEKLKIDKNDIESFAEVLNWDEVDQVGLSWENVSKYLLCNNNKYLFDEPSYLHSEVLNKIVKKIDNGDGRIQEKEYTLFKRLLNMANSYVETLDEKLDENIISLRGLNILLQKIEDGTVDIDKLKKDIEKEESVEYLYPQAEDITQTLSIELVSKYDIKVFKTNTIKKYDGVNDGKGKLEYNTYVISFIEPETGITHNLNIHLDKHIEKEENIEEIIAAVAENNTNIVDLMLNEINDLYVTSEENNTKKYGGKNNNDGYEKIHKEFSAVAFYLKSDESINIYYDEGYFYSDIENLVHELGHAKDNDSDTKFELYKLIEKENIKKSDFFKSRSDELYAEFFQDYHNVQDVVSFDFYGKYEDIANQLSDELVQRFIEEAAVSFLTDQDMTISSILDRAELSEYKELFGGELNKKLKLSEKIPQANSDAEKMKKMAKNNPKIGELHIKLMHEIAHDYNHPKENVQRYFKKK